MDRQALEQRVRSMYAAFAAGDTETYEAAFSESIVGHVPGDNPVSGAYRGVEEYFGTMVESPSISKDPERAGRWTWMGAT
jgi:ketosteroid isomerase-like protein